MTTYRIEKRVANTEQWAVVGREATEETARDTARRVVGGESTGVRIVPDGDPYAEPEIVLGC